MLPAKAALLGALLSQAEPIEDIQQKPRIEIIRTEEVTPEPEPEPVKEDDREKERERERERERAREKEKERAKRREAALTEPEPEPEPARPPPPVPVMPGERRPGREEGGILVRGAIEGLLGTYPSGVTDGAQDFFGWFTPLLGVDGGDDFGFEFGAQLRLRIFDDAPSQRATDRGGFLRGEDWDERSDYGQILRELRVGQEGDDFHLKAGPLYSHTLGRGHLVNRYTNRLNPDYHPAGAALSFNAGPVHAEAFASDLLALRILAADVSVDLAQLTSQEEAHFDRYHASLSFAHDGARARAAAPQMTLASLDLDAALYKTSRTQLTTLLGFGIRLDTPRPSVGAVLGATLDTDVAGMGVGGKAELRKHEGSYRQGMFGASYELSRFAGLGLAGVPLAQELLPDAFSAYFEGQVFLGGDESNALFSLLTSGAVEFFSFGRTDADAWIQLRFLEGKGAIVGRFIAVGVNAGPRFLFQGEGRYRFIPSLYAVALTGTTYFPQQDQTLSRGFYALFGVGADFER